MAAFELSLKLNISTCKLINLQAENSLNHALMIYNFSIFISYFNRKKYFGQENSNIIVQFTCKQHTPGPCSPPVQTFHTENTQGSRKEHSEASETPSMIA